MVLLSKSFLQEKKFDSLELLPKHIAIIMDGNRRWAKERGLPILEGHRKGVKALRNTAEAMKDFGIHYLTVFAFSTENNSRSPEEVSGLMSIILMTLKNELAEIHKNKIKLKFIGHLGQLPEKVCKMIDYAEKLTAQNSDFYLTIALNYGAHQDITGATQKIAQKIKDGDLEVDEITPDHITENLSTSFLPTPDILIRTSGEQRISNFLLWELSYAEMFFVPTYWPDFNKQILEEVLIDFQGRNRRYGR